MSDMQRIIDGTSPVLEAWDMLPTGTADDHFWTTVAPTVVGMIGAHSLEQEDLTLVDAVMLLNLCERRLRGVDVEDMISSINNRVRRAGNLMDRLTEVAQEIAAEGEDK